MYVEKQIKVLEKDLILIYSSFVGHVGSSRGREFILAVYKRYSEDPDEWQISIRPTPDAFLDRLVIAVEEKHKAQEVRRQIMKFLTQS